MDEFKQYLQIRLSCATEGASIFYTLDGSPPSSASSRYSGPFYIFATTTVKAVARKDELADSTVASRQFTRLAPAESAATLASIASSRKAYKPGDQAAFAYNLDAGAGNCDLYVLVVRPDETQTYLGGGADPVKCASSIALPGRAVLAQEYPLPTDAPSGVYTAVLIATAADNFDSPIAVSQCCFSVFTDGGLAVLAPGFIGMFGDPIQASVIAAQSAAMLSESAQAFGISASLQKPNGGMLYAAKDPLLDRWSWSIVDAGPAWSWASADEEFSANLPSFETSTSDGEGSYTLEVKIAGTVAGTSGTIFSSTCTIATNGTPSQASFRLPLGFMDSYPESRIYDRYFSITLMDLFTNRSFAATHPDSGGVFSAQITEGQYMVFVRASDLRYPGIVYFQSIDYTPGMETIQLAPKGSGRAFESMSDAELARMLDFGFDPCPKVAIVKAPENTADVTGNCFEIDMQLLEISAGGCCKGDDSEDGAGLWEKIYRIRNPERFKDRPTIDSYRNSTRGRYEVDVTWTGGANGATVSNAPEQTATVIRVDYDSNTAPVSLSVCLRNRETDEIIAYGTFTDIPFNQARTSLYEFLCGGYPNITARIRAGINMDSPPAYYDYSVPRYHPVSPKDVKFTFSPDKECYSAGDTITVDLIFKECNSVPIASFPMEVAVVSGPEVMTISSGGDTSQTIVTATTDTTGRATVTITTLPDAAAEDIRLSVRRRNSSGILVLPEQLVDIPANVRIVSTTPANEATGVITTAPIVISFSNIMAPEATAGSIAIEPAIAIEPSWNIEQTVLTLTPSTPLAVDTAYTVTVGTGAESMSGEKLASAYSFSFRTSAALSVVTHSPENGAVDIVPDFFSWIGLLFSRSMNTEKTQASISVTPTLEYTVDWMGQSESEPQLITLTPTSPPEAGVTYKVTVGTEAEAADGSTLSEPYSFSFTMAPAPKVVAFSPANGAVDVPTNAQLSMTFSEPMSEYDVYSNLSISPDLYPYWSSALVWNEDKTSFTFTFPAIKFFQAETTYTVSLSTEAESKLYVHLKEPFSFQFTTEEAIFGRVLPSGRVNENLHPFQDGKVYDGVYGWHPYEMSGNDVLVYASETDHTIVDIIYDTFSYTYWYYGDGQYHQVNMIGDYWKKTSGDVGSVPGTYIQRFLVQGVTHTTVVELYEDNTAIVYSLPNHPTPTPGGWHAFFDESMKTFSLDFNFVDNNDYYDCWNVGWIQYGGLFLIHDPTKYY